MNVRAGIWWSFFIPMAIMLQAAVPALDALLIGLILILQERRYKSLFWLLPLLILLQEGIGSRPFGGMVLWYFMIIILFAVGRWLFEVQNILFVLLISVCLGLLHFALVYLMAPLQDLPVNVHTLLQESIIQTLFVPWAWWIAAFTRKWTHGHGDIS